MGIKDTTYLKKLVFVDVDGTICTAGMIPHGELVAFQVFQGKIEMGKGMGAVNQNGNIFFAG